MQEALRATCETGAIQTYEVATPGPDGALIWFASQIAPIRIGGQIVGAVLVSQEVTEKKREHAELVAARHMALLGTLAAGVAHEINTPIQFVGDSLQFFREATRDLLGLLDKLRELRKLVMLGVARDVVMNEIAKAEERPIFPTCARTSPGPWTAVSTG
jgi:signal transduction histidine kinase